MNKDQVKGRVKEAKGTIKEVAGKLVGNESMEAKGKVEKTLGKAQAKFGDVKQDVKDATKAG
ncbi:MAG TPA: CsbD family protein [Casimicrobiaceae bacterium]|nr:CsbD family protein [Casimicrobiaceae bacterium]